MKVAFYAPLKAPDDPVPSGDRLIGRMLVKALEAGGHEVLVVSRLRSFDRGGDAERQARIERIGARESMRTLRRMRASGFAPDLWLTYHLYHKAPDWLGPAAARALGIPYCVAEASSTPRHAAGRWALGHCAVVAALAEASLVISINPKDVPGIGSLVGPKARLASIPPFIDGAIFRAARDARSEHRDRLARQFALDTTQPWLLAVGMMRDGDKARSYEILAHALALLADRSWQLLIVGDGAARETVEAGFAGLSRRVRFCGACPSSEVAAIMASSDLLVWPAINEAIGMTFIEAAMAGLPAVGADRPGVAATVEHDVTGLLAPEADAPAFANAVVRLLENAELRRRMGTAAASRAAVRNDLVTSGKLVCAELEAVAQ
jgi:glycosyltransferase involved in cell wall biosynthesis